MFSTVTSHFYYHETVRENLNSLKYYFSFLEGYEGLKIRDFIQTFWSSCSAKNTVPLNFKF